MYEINCEVDNCSHNKSGTCYSDRINIGGKSASNEYDTCCGSFLDELLYSSLSNNTKPNDCCDCVVCNVESCSHNYNNLCDLDSINISGDDVKLYSETNCASFELK